VRLTRAKESLSRAKERLSHAKESLSHAKESLSRAKESLSHAKESLSRARESVSIDILCGAPIILIAVPGPPRREIAGLAAARRLLMPEPPAARRTLRIPRGWKDSNGKQPTLRQ